MAPWASHLDKHSKLYPHKKHVFKFKLVFPIGIGKVEWEVIAPDVRCQASNISRADAGKDQQHGTFDDQH